MSISGDRRLSELRLGKDRPASRSPSCRSNARPCTAQSHLTRAAYSFSGCRPEGLPGGAATGPPSEGR